MPDAHKSDVLKRPKKVLAVALALKPPYFAGRMQVLKRPEPVPGRLNVIMKAAGCGYESGLAVVQSRPKLKPRFCFHSGCQGLSVPPHGLGSLLGSQLISLFFFQ